METIQMTKTGWLELTHQLGRDFEERSAAYDEGGTFASRNYEQLKTHKYFSATIPEELGGEGMSHKLMCEHIRIIAHYCGSTALAFSMHQHLIAASVWKYKHKNEGAAMLRNVAEHQLVLISTGAKDWLGSNGEMKRIDGGYLFSGRKQFASQSANGDIVVTSAPFFDGGKWKVLHFSVPMKANGVSLADDWDTLGMRGTGSQSIIFNQVFIPESAITLERPKDEFHTIWDIVLSVALPLIMAAYVGIAEKAMEMTISKAKESAGHKNQVATLVGRLNNELLSAQTQWRAMFALSNNLDFKPNSGITHAMLSYKTNVADATRNVVAGAMEVIGGQSYYKKSSIERLFRDVQASQFHPLPKWEQYAFTGEKLLS